jgi:hypothetical protein
MKYGTRRFLSSDLAAPPRVILANQTLSTDNSLEGHGACKLTVETPIVENRFAHAK